MRRFAGVAVLLLLTVVPRAHAQYQTAASLPGGITSPNLTPTIINPTGTIYTPSANKGAFNFVGFNPGSFFRSVGNFFMPPQVGNSTAGTLVSGPTPFPSTIYQFPTTGPVPLSNVQLPTMQVTTSFQN
jgi:hypothetical protein